MRGYTDTGGHLAYVPLPQLRSNVERGPPDLIHTINVHRKPLLLRQPQQLPNELNVPSHSSGVQWCTDSMPSHRWDQ
jgi:hypothetical protein